MTSGIIQGKWNRLPGGEIVEAKTSDVVFYVCRSVKTYLHIPQKEGSGSEEITMGMEQDECLLRLPAEESDIPAIVALVASRRSKRRSKR